MDKSNALAGVYIFQTETLRSIGGIDAALPSGLIAGDGQTRFELTLWVLFERVSSLIERPTGTVVELVKGGDDRAHRNRTT